MAHWSSSSLSLSVPVSELEKSVSDQNSLLCVSDGFSIYCLDLDRIGKDCFDYPENLPLVSSINLLKEHYPISGALFQLGSLGLMIGGREIPDFKQFSDISMSPHGFEGSSKEIHQLFLADGTLRLSFYGGIPFLPLENPKSWHKGIPPLKNPRIWPIVEKIDNHLHVIESIPLCFAHILPRDWFPSHEVLDLDDVDHGWTEVSRVGINRSDTYGQFMADKLVLGDRMFAVPFQGCAFLEFYDLDCKSNNKCWKFHQRTYEDSWFHVTELLSRGSCICVGRFDKPVLGYAVIGFIDDIKEGDDLGEWYSVASAMAVLATPAGDIICYQSLPEFFDGVVPLYSSVSTVFCNDINTSSRSTFCVVLVGEWYDRAELEASLESVLYISTFCVEEADLDCLSVLSGIAEERKFLKIRLLKKQVYKLGQILRTRGDTLESDSLLPPPPRLTACFI